MLFAKTYKGHIRAPVILALLEMVLPVQVKFTSIDCLTHTYMARRSDRHFLEMILLFKKKLSYFVQRKFEQVIDDTVNYCLSEVEIDKRWVATRTAEKSNHPDANGRYRETHGTQKQQRSRLLSYRQ